MRDSVILALQYWKGVSGSDNSPELSETGYSVKGELRNCFFSFSFPRIRNVLDVYIFFVVAESYNEARENSELFSTTDSKLKNATSNKYVTDLGRKKIPVSAKRAPTRYNDDTQKKTKPDNWHIEIAVAESPILSNVDLHNEESQGSCITKTFAEATNTREVTYEYIPMEDKSDYYVTGTDNGNDDIKSVTVSSSSFLASGTVVNPAITSKHFVAEETYSEDQLFLSNVKDRTSLDSTVTVSSSEINHDCCAQIATEMASVRKQLSDIENKQSRLIDQLKVSGFSLTI